VKRALALMLLAGLAACASGPGSRRGERAPDGQRVLRGYDGSQLERTASPSALVAEQIALSQAAREDGQWTALRDFAADDAVMFVPQLVRAQDWLNNRADPAAAMRWQPHEVVMSCDGRTGATTGAMQRPDGSFGYYTTIWHRPYTRSGKWGWVLTHEATLATPRPEPDFVRTRIGDCRGDVPTVTQNAAPTANSIEGRSDDRTIVWRAMVQPDGSRQVIVDLWQGSGYETVIDDRVAAPQGNGA